MFMGDNEGGKLFEVIDEDFDVLGGFDTIEEAIACGRAAPWFHGAVRVRRDRALVAASLASNIAARRARIDAFNVAFCWDE